MPARTSVSAHLSVSFFCQINFSLCWVAWLRDAADLHYNYKMVPSEFDPIQGRTLIGQICVTVIHCCHVGTDLSPEPGEEEGLGLYEVPGVNLVPFSK